MMLYVERYTTARHMRGRLNDAEARALQTDKQSMFNCSPCRHDYMRFRFYLQSTHCYGMVVFHPHALGNGWLRFRCWLWAAHDHDEC